MISPGHVEVKYKLLNRFDKGAKVCGDKCEKDVCSWSTSILLDSLKRGWNKLLTACQSFYSITKYHAVRQAFKVNLSMVVPCKCAGNIVEVHDVSRYNFQTVDPYMLCIDRSVSSNWCVVGPFSVYNWVTLCQYMEICPEWYWPELLICHKLIKG